jgi:hypothetical protein
MVTSGVGWLSLNKRMRRKDDLAKGTMLLNGAEYAPFNLYGVGVLWRIPGREFTETTDFVVQLRGRVNSPR